MIVEADTTPINYLVLIGRIEILRTLYSRVVIPVAVRDELLSSHAPVAVQSWATHLPAWISVCNPTVTTLPGLDKLDRGERDAISLAEELAADQLIIDEVLGRKAALQRGLPVIGTIGVLREAALVGVLDIHAAVAALRSTSFHIAPEILANLLRPFPVEMKS